MALEWLGTVGSEGGALVVCDLASFSDWPGNEDEDFDLEEVQEKGAAVVAFGKTNGLFWDPRSPGSMRVGVTKTGSEVVLLFAIVDDEASAEAFKGKLDTALPSEKARGTIKMKDVAVVAWSPPSAESIANETFDGELEDGVRKALKKKRSARLDGDISRIGLAFAVESGAFKVTVGEQKGKEATFRWCRLKRA